MDLTNVIGKIVDIDWIKSKTMWVSIVFDIVYAGLTYAVFVLGELPLEQGATIAATLGMIQSQMMKYMRMITNTGILPINPKKRQLVIEEEEAAINELGARTTTPAPVTGALKEPASVFESSDGKSVQVDSAPTIPQVVSSIISAAQYFGKKLTDSSMGIFSSVQIKNISDNADDLLTRANLMLRDFYSETGKKLVINPFTGTLISGSMGGSGDGGFRLPNSTTGSPNSSHRKGEGVDIADLDGDLDNWITDEKLEKYGLYREHPSATRSWCHVTTRAPGSFAVTGNRTFYP